MLDWSTSVHTAIEAKPLETQRKILMTLGVFESLSGKPRDEQNRIVHGLSLLRCLKPLSQPDRISALELIGFTEEQALDCVKSLFPDVSPIARIQESNTRKATDSDERMKATLARIQAMAEKARANPEKQKQEAYTLFERHKAHNRFLLGGATDFDEASFANPAFDASRKAAAWFRNEFIPSGKRIGLLLGGTGVGKTWASLAYIAQTATVEWSIVGLKVIRTNAAYVTAYRISEMLNQRNRFQEKLDELRRVPILLIDELGGEGPEFRGDNSKFSAYLDSLFGERHQFRNMKTLITSNHTFAKLNEAYGERIMSRIMDVGCIFTSGEKDMRGS